MLPGLEERAQGCHFSVLRVRRKGLGIKLSCSVGWKEGPRDPTFLLPGLEERA